MVDRSDLLVCYIEHNSGGAFQTVQYAKKKNKEIVNLSDQKRTICQFASTLKKQGRKIQNYLL